MALPILTEEAALAQGLESVFAKGPNEAAIDAVFPTVVQRTALHGATWPVAISAIFTDDGQPVRAAFMRPMTQAELDATADDRLRATDRDAWVKKQMEAADLQS